LRCANGGSANGRDLRLRVGSSDFWSRLSGRRAGD
jgi:hypothetical protein